MKIVVPDHIELSKDNRAKLEKIPDVTIYDDVVNTPGQIIARIKHAEVVTASFIDLTEEVINKSLSLKYIISPAKGFDWIDVKTATKRGIKILNCPTFNSRAVAEHTFALLLAVKRRIIEAHNSILRNEFKQFVGSELFGKRVLTIGYGEIGTKVLKIANGFGMKTMYANSKTSSKSLDIQISQADVVVLCLSLNVITEGIMNKKRITLMKKDAILINVARGLLVDQIALLNALKENKIAGAGIDTFPNDATIKIPSKQILDFAKLPNCVTTPHIAYNTIESTERLGAELLADIYSCIKGKPINVVN